MSEIEDIFSSKKASSVSASSHSVLPKELHKGAAETEAGKVGKKNKKKLLQKEKKKAVTAALTLAQQVSTPHAKGTPAAVEKTIAKQPKSVVVVVDADANSTSSSPAKNVTQVESSVALNNPKAKKEKKSSVKGADTSSVSLPPSATVSTKGKSSKSTSALSTGKSKIKGEKGNTEGDETKEKGGEEEDDGFADSRGKSSKRKYTEDGLPIYDEDELRCGSWGFGGGTELCPFDCQCCF